jgi:hypothetical protein
MTEPTDSYSDYFDEHGQPVRRGVVLTDEKEREFALFFSDTPDQIHTEESA